MSINNTLIFKSIHSFITQLNEEFGSKHKPLRLYGRLMEHIKDDDIDYMTKHVDVVKAFCIENSTGIIDKDITEFINPTLNFSDRIFIDLSYIFKIADTETKEVIWEHLLTISALVDSKGKAKDVLRNNLNKKIPKTPEGDFLSGMLDKLTPMLGSLGSSEGGLDFSSLGGILQSPVFKEMVGSITNGIQDGKLDLGNLLGTIQQVCGKETDGSTPNIVELVNMLGDDGKDALSSGLGSLKDIDPTEIVNKLKDVNLEGLEDTFKDINLDGFDINKLVDGIKSEKMEELVSSLTLEDKPVIDITKDKA